MLQHANRTGWCDVARFKRILIATCLCGTWIAQPPAYAQSAQAALTLPEAPDAAQTGSDVPATATLSGRVTDTAGAPLEGASVTLTSPGQPQRTLVSDEQGYFSFRDVIPGRYDLTVSLTGLQTYQNAAVVLESNQALALPPIALAVAGTTAVVHVTATPTEIADAQVDEEVHQRLLGIVPNFYTSYVWDAVPLDTGQKFRLASHSVFDPVSFFVAGAAAGGQQLTNQFGQYGGGFEGYAKRYGANYADIFIGRMLTSAVLASAFHEDPRYFYKGSGTTRQRTIYAIERSVIARNDQGHDRFSYSRVLGFFAAGAISNAYHPSHDRGVGLTLMNASIDLGGSAVDNLFREFLWRKLTKHLPPDENGEASVGTTASSAKH